MAAAAAVDPDAPAAAATAASVRIFPAQFGNSAYDCSLFKSPLLRFFPPNASGKVRVICESISGGIFCSLFFSRSPLRIFVVVVACKLSLVQSINTNLLSYPILLRTLTVIKSGQVFFFSHSSYP